MATTLAIGLGAIFTWLAATSLEGYALGHNARARAQIDQMLPKVATNGPADDQYRQWMF
jgi:hypothetical protein